MAHEIQMPCNRAAPDNDARTTQRPSPRIADENASHAVCLGNAVHRTASDSFARRQERRSIMKKWILLSAIGVAAASASFAASAHVDLSIGIGLPGVVAAPPPVVYAPPPPAYYAPPPAYGPPPATLPPK
jgi:hypothetical protein